MNIYSLAYVSESCLDDFVLDTRVEMAKILSTAKSRNAILGVTGALMFTERHFTQLLEGPRDAVVKIFASIERDPRHKNVSILGIQHSESRHFADWAMVFAGTSDTAKAYYKDYVADRIRWSAMRNDDLGALLLKLVLMDDAASSHSLQPQ